MRHLIAQYNEEERTPLHVEESYVNATEGHRIGNSGVYETRYDNPGDLFRAMRREYGRCTGRVYVDKPDGGAKPVGWVFVKRDRYEDTGKPYLREVWVTVHERKPEVKRTHFYKDTGD